MSVSNYQRVLDSLYQSDFAPSTNGVGILFTLLVFGRQYDGSDSTSSNPFQDLLTKVEAVLPDSPYRREVLQLLSDRASQTAQGF
jgi:hypothetical protein